MTRDWDASTYDRVADPMARWGAAVLERLPLPTGEYVVAGPHRLPPEDDVAQRSPDDVCGVAGPPDRPQQVVDGSRDRCLDRGRRTSQLRPRNRYERHASLRSSPR